MHALLYRKWKSRVKGRDWFDLEWYIKIGIAVNCRHLTQRARQSGDWNSEESINKESLLKLLADKIAEVNFNQVKADIMRFIPNPELIEIWNEPYFLDLIKQLKTIDE